jgi:hypothetical protein
MPSRKPLPIRLMLQSKPLSRPPKKSLFRLRRKRPMLKAQLPRRKHSPRLPKKRLKLLFRNPQRHTNLRKLQLHNLRKKLMSPAVNARQTKNPLRREIIKSLLKRGPKQLPRQFLMEVRLKPRLNVSLQRLPRRPFKKQQNHLLKKIKAHHHPPHPALTQHEC